MKSLSKLLVVAAMVCALVSVAVKMIGKGLLLSGGGWPWLRLTGLFLLFSIAVSLAWEDKK